MAKGGKPLGEEALRQVARRFAVLGEPMRLRILQALMDGERPVNALVEATGGTQTNVSRHLQTLASAGLTVTHVVAGFFLAAVRLSSSRA